VRLYLAVLLGLAFGLRHVPERDQRPYGLGCAVVGLVLLAFLHALAQR
jgi:hypothetical protein